MKIDEVIGRRLRKAIKNDPRGGLRFGIRLSDFLGREWSKQTVYDAAQGLRKFRVAELVAIARATNRPVHYFLDAAAENQVTIEVESGGPTVDAEELRDLFRIAEPRDLSSDDRIVLNQIEGTIEQLEAECRDLRYAAKRLRGDQS